MTDGCRKKIIPIVPPFPTGIRYDVLVHNAGATNGRWGRSREEGNIMRKTTLTMLASVALATALTACGGAGGTGGTVTDTPTDTPIEVEDVVMDDDTEGDDEGTVDTTDDKDNKKTDATDDDSTDDATRLTDDEKEEAKKKAESDGKTVLAGKVVIIDGPDIFEYEGMDPKVMGGKETEEGNTYAILELDEDTKISGMGADGFPREENHDLIGLGHDLPKYDDIKDTASQWKKYEGKRICVAGDAVFPTDVSFPKEGTLHDAELLYVEE